MNIHTPKSLENDKKIYLNPKPSEQLSEALTFPLNLNEMSYKEMIRLFNEKEAPESSQEGLILTENRARAFLLFNQLSLLGVEKLESDLNQLMLDHPHLQGACFVRSYKDKIFLSFEPLLPTGKEQEILQCFADQIQEKIQNLI